MTDRVSEFLANAGWGTAQRKALAGDASSRRYERLRREDGSAAVLMIAPPMPDDSTCRFAALARYLAAQGLSAPDILAGSEEDGLLVLEDLGGTVFAEDMQTDPALEAPLYEAAVDLLVALQTCPPPADLPRYTPQDMAAMTAPAADWYMGMGRPRPELAEAFAAALAPALAAVRDGSHPWWRTVTIMWKTLSGYRTGRVLPVWACWTFQDAFAGLPAYDLVSLLEDARRDVSAQLRAGLTARFAAATATAPDDLHTALHVLGAQRNLRILGVFARLCLQAGKARYVDLIPRVWDNLQRDMAHPALSKLRAATGALPAPSPDFLKELRTRCGTVPTP